MSTLNAPFGRANIDRGSYELLITPVILPYYNNPYNTPLSSPLENPLFKSLGCSPYHPRE